MGLPLAFVALPLYVILPHHYAQTYGVPLGTLGALLLSARLFDALTDPLLGRWSDQLFARSARAVLGYGGAAAVLLGMGLSALFFPPVTPGPTLLAWAAVALLITGAAYSFLSITHQSWAARQGGDEAERSRIVGWREGLGLVGVLLASILPVVAGLASTVAAFFIAVTVAWGAWAQSPPPTQATPEAPTVPGANPSPTVAPTRSLWHPFTRPAFRRLLLVFMLNGIASAVPATLVLFFVQDRLLAPARLQPAFLGSYFLCAALSIPLWLYAVKHIGLARCWLAGMVLAMAVFIWALQLGAGDSMPFLLVCALSGIALGTDLTLPGALLAGVIQRAGDSGHREGSYLGWWNFATKLNLALAAGLALPLLALFGYAPGTHDPQALHALGVAYCLLPCALKAVAALCLYQWLIRNPT